MTFSIKHLFIKVKQGSAMVEMKTLNLKVGYGIEGDINADPISPRQVLIIRYEDILDLSIQPGEFRENIVITGTELDNFIPGSLLTFKSGAAIRLTFYCEPCKRISYLVESLKDIKGKRGILGVVIKSGKIEVGSNFQIQAHKFSALSENPYKRFLDFIIKIPSGKVVTYKQIIKGIGVDNSYLRAIPTYLKKTSVADYPLHRILDSKGYLINYVSQQKNKLETEGVKVLSEADLLSNLKNANKNFVDIKDYLWEDYSLYLK
ncbi:MULTISPECIES: MGMT family protein [unclassified Nostoc]|uniref:MGMT family protein n=1 Tax=unclassified Nostoc TaxID=2593658 RepID=UPI002AD3B5FB|nr:MGMT family protein [Nostoc sp. DedQUE03]MDZ7977242.1 MGMT family protein [Nostoc sp. DedQUE03]MDZ8047637.1 MGMT family protein [Nostoc sp. DedQUE02]